MLPNDVASDREGNMYISDTENNRIRMVDKDGIIHTVAGSGKEGDSGDRGPATKAALNLPIGVALDGEGNCTSPATITAGSARSIPRHDHDGGRHGGGGPPIDTTERETC